MAYSFKNTVFRSVLLLLVLICIPSLCLASEPERPVVIEIIRGGTQLVAGQGIQRGADLWIPLPLLQSYGVALSSDIPSSMVCITIPSPAQKLGIPELGAYCGNQLDLDFKGRLEGGSLLLNHRGLEKITGLKAEPTGNGNILLRPMVSGDALPERVSAPQDKITGKINLVWDHVSNANADLSSEDRIPGLDVISPTWFSLRDERGAISNLANINYVEEAHRKGYRVWALASNGFKKDRTRQFLASARARDLYIARLMAYAVIYDLDGINIDFENVDDQDRARLTFFVDRLTKALHKLGLIVSIDVTIPSKVPGWSRCYDRPALAKIVDYVMLMAYDEHWRTSPKAGSTASIPWVRSGVERTLEQVPAHKLLLGIPFYTREWEETHRPGKKPSVRSKALSMISVDERIRTYNAPVRWLGDKGQHYTAYQKDGKLYRIWLENERSMELRAAMIKHYKLAGAASWRKGFEKPAIWNVLNSALKAPL